MFDAVSNPFAVQNLLAKEADAFTSGAFRPAAESRQPVPFVVNRMVHEDHSAGSAGSFTPDPMRAAPDEAPAQSEETEQISPYAEEDSAYMPEGLEAQLGEELIAQLSAELDDALAGPAVSQEAEYSEPDFEHAADSPLATAEPVTALTDEPVSAEPAGVDLSDEAITSLIAAAREEGRHAGHNQGFAAGYAKASADLQQAHSEQIAAEQAALRTLCEGVQQLANDGDALFEPLKRLSMHLAEQLVRGELSLSGHAISRLIDNCVREMTGTGEKTLQVQLHPEDLEQYRPLVAQGGQAMSLRANPALKRGSVRVSLESAVVEDLIEHRLEALAKTLTQTVSGGGSGRSPLSARLGSGESRQSVEDVRSRALPPESSPSPPQSAPLAESVTAYASDDGYV